MISAEIPEDESQRLQALYNYEILDTEAEEVFDNLTLLASQICETPIALISLIDPNRQWFKSKVGLDAEETSRDIAFCAHAINQTEVFEVCDTLKDLRFRDNPLVSSEPNIRFYAGSPLISPEGYAIGTLCAISDKPKQLSEPQKNALQVLANEVISQLELRRKIQQVSAANERKTDFLTKVSHELRTPLNAIISFSQLMVNDSSIDLNEKHQRYLQHLDSSGKRLLALVDSILDLNKIEAGKMEIRYSLVDAEEFFTSLKTNMLRMADKKDINLHFTAQLRSDTKIYLDENKVIQVALNILSNGIKFSASGQTIEVNIVQYENELEIVIKDHGVGIAKKDMPKIFDKFQQGEQRKNYEGSGLGLMITKSLVELMGGKIQLTSNENIGTLVKVTLPFGDPDTNVLSQSPKKLELEFNTSSKILVVEDNEINREVALAIFASLGLNIIIAESGEEALKILDNNHFDMIFMDIHLPGMDGYQTTKEIKNRNSEQIVVALTADVYAEQDRRIVESGLCEIVNKPVDIQQLIAVLNRFIPIRT